MVVETLLLYYCLWEMITNTFHNQQIENMYHVTLYYIGSNYPQKNPKKDRKIKLLIKLDLHKTNDSIPTDLLRFPLNLK